MLSFMDKSRLTIQHEPEIHFIRPLTASEIGSSAPRQDSVCSGSLILTLSKDKELPVPTAISSKGKEPGKITVSIVGQADVAFGELPYESATIYDNSVTLSAIDATQANARGAVVLRQGDHTFDWSFIIQSSIAPYERSRYGRITYWIKAVACGMGPLGSDLTATRRLAFIASPGGSLAQDAEQGLSSSAMQLSDLALFVDIREPNCEIGSLHFNLLSKQFTVSGLALFNLAVSMPPQEIDVASVTLSMTQRYELTSPRRFAVKDPVPASKATVKVPPPHRRTVVKLDGHSEYAAGSNLLEAHELLPDTTLSEEDAQAELEEQHRGRHASTHGHHSSGMPAATITRSGPLSASPSPSTTPRGQSPSRGGFRSTSRKPSKAASGSDKPLKSFKRLRVGERLTTSWLARVPNDDVLRPSTHPGSITPIRVSHELALEIRYSLPDDPKTRILTIKKPVLLASCCCSDENLKLPSYEEVAGPASEYTSPDTHPMADTRHDCQCRLTFEQLLQEQKTWLTSELVSRRYGAQAPTSAALEAAWQAKSRQ
ncbi:uncharacterized protein L969DRAFT_19252 [Mixia osmundae IAM 14324]|uniref:uncharacterized protein n=1 Tax=Mixia osmundae (strain CBS 9802 / IAM 14324 / JCM 22182 / KY 12970) TaxID=764103 RepID=UPI0004A5571D|nr:uncharacterized protein L969DRAFT_19252 [Mixia osmundae IAM 14324]KEI37776.1 hypothetical protein L969DRAFT_19252 [Mixia osmundae IAM 14324]